MKELFKQAISYIYTDEDKHYLIFIDNWGEDYWVYEAQGDCCSESWFEAINNPENIINRPYTFNDKTIIGIEEKPEKVCCEKKCDKCIKQECVKIYGYTLKTVAGYTDIELRNASNGYYGGSCEYEPNAHLVYSERDLTDKERIQVLKSKTPISLKLCANSKPIKLFAWNEVDISKRWIAI